MLKLLKILILVMVPMVSASFGCHARVLPFNILDKLADSKKIPLDSVAIQEAARNEKVIVKGDTVSVILPQKNPEQNSFYCPFRIFYLSRRRLPLL